MVGGILGQEPTSDPELLFAFIGACGFQAVFFGLPGIQSGHLEEQMIDVVLVANGSPAAVATQDLRQNRPSRGGQSQPFNLSTRRDALQLRVNFQYSTPIDTIMSGQREPVGSETTHTAETEAAWPVQGMRRGRM